MKKICFSLAFMLIGSFAFANNVTPSDAEVIKTLSSDESVNLSQNIEKKNDELGRQTCTKTFYMEDGSSITISASAGWFLSDDASAMTRACQKVNEAVGIE